MNSTTINKEDLFKDITNSTDYCHFLDPKKLHICQCGMPVSEIKSCPGRGKTVKRTADGMHIICGRLICPDCSYVASIKRRST